MSMTPQQMQELIRDTAERLCALHAMKSHDYTQGANDAFANFKRCGARLGNIKDPAFIAWATYYMKHEDALWTYLEGKPIKDTAEPPERRIDDMIVYLLLLKGEIISRRHALLDEVIDELAEESPVPDNGRCRYVAPGGRCVWPEGHTSDHHYERG